MSDFVAVRHPDLPHSEFVDCPSCGGAGCHGCAFTGQVRAAAVRIPTSALDDYKSKGWHEYDPDEAATKEAAKAVKADEPVPAELDPDLPTTADPPETRTTSRQRRTSTTKRS